MSTSISAFIATIPAGTAPASPATIPLTVGPDPVTSIHWRVPPGSRGEMGWYLTQSGAQVLPDRHGTLIVADGESDTWTLDNFPQSGAWAVVGYNVGSNPHSVYLEFGYSSASPVGTTLTGDILTGFPTTDAELLTAFLT